MSSNELVVLVLILVVAVLAIIVYLQGKREGAAYPPETKGLVEQINRSLGFAVAGLVLVASRTEGKTDDQMAALAVALFRGLGIEVPALPTSTSEVGQITTPAAPPAPVAQAIKPAGDGPPAVG